MFRSFDPVVLTPCLPSEFWLLALLLRMHRYYSRSETNLLRVLLIVCIFFAKLLLPNLLSLCFCEKLQLPIYQLDEFYAVTVPSLLLLRLGMYYMSGLKLICCVFDSLIVFLLLNQYS